MALLGRRKPGFATTEVVDPRTLSDAVNEDNIVTPCPAAEQAAGQPPVTEPLPANMVQALAQFVRNHSRSGYLVSLAQLSREDPNVPTLYAQMAADPVCGDIRGYQTAKDTYLYEEGTMSELYLMLNALVLDGDDVNTIVTLVRYNSKVFPTVTPLDYFFRTPFSMTQEQVDAAVEAILSTGGELADIAETQGPSGNRYLYSTDHLTPVYAKSLAEFAEAND
ncbi:hypothetical protein [Vermiculatibacterium agrestimuris]|uniref:hypothetical protein n=1 Tax=Vermiculatibacterium agrestimuris TaxID=2941519 RepID=UPI002040F724|nr:hypothetical protein [Vermiculatibacterium agrestimuris]